MTNIYLNNDFKVKVSESFILLSTSVEVDPNCILLEFSYITNGKIKKFRRYAQVFLLKVSRT